MTKSYAHILTIDTTTKHQHTAKAMNLETFIKVTFDRFRLVDRVLILGCGLHHRRCHWRGIACRDPFASLAQKLHRHTALDQGRNDQDLWRVQGQVHVIMLWPGGALHWLFWLQARNFCHHSQAMATVSNQSPAPLWARSTAMGPGQIVHFGHPSCGDETISLFGTKGNWWCLGLGPCAGHRCRQKSMVWPRVDGSQGRNKCQWRPFGPEHVINHVSSVPRHQDDFHIVHRVWDHAGRCRHWRPARGSLVLVQWKQGFGGERTAHRTHDWCYTWHSRTPAAAPFNGSSNRGNPGWVQVCSKSGCRDRCRANQTASPTATRKDGDQIQVEWIGQ